MRLILSCTVEEAYLEVQKRRDRLREQAEKALKQVNKVCLNAEAAGLDTALWYIGGIQNHANLQKEKEAAKESPPPTVQ